MTLMGGMVVGAALTLLFAPQSGADLRGQIKDFVDKEIDRVKSGVAEMADRIESTRCHCADK